MDLAKMFENVNLAILASNTDYKVVYQNERCRKLFGEEFNRADYLGADLSQCHRPETTEKIKGYFKEYKGKERALDYYVIKEDDNTVTVVNVPFYDGGEFAGVVEFIFESSLA